MSINEQIMSMYMYEYANEICHIWHRGCCWMMGVERMVVHICIHDCVFCEEPSVTNCLGGAVGIT